MIEKMEYKTFTFNLTDPVEYEWYEQLATKIKKRTRSLLTKSTYTPDFVLSFTPKARNILFFDRDTLYKKNPFNCLYFYSQIAIIDVKGGFDKYGHSHKQVFNIIRKMVSNRFGIYVHRIEVPDIFKKTFTPERYMWTDKMTKQRTFAFETVSLDKFLEYGQQWRDNYTSKGMDETIL